MNAYVQFTEIKSDNSIKDCMGSDGVFILDGRNKLDTMIQDAEDRLQKIKKLKPWFTGYIIYKGDFKNNTLLFQI